jgi:hypothetical protein
MGVNGQLHAPAAFHLGMESPVLIGGVDMFWLKMDYYYYYYYYYHHHHHHHLLSLHMLFVGVGCTLCFSVNVRT